MTVSEINPARIHLENIFKVMDRLTFGKDTSAMIVGGRKKLMRLIDSGEIEVIKESDAQNGKWKCNASHVLQHCRNMR